MLNQEQKKQLQEANDAVNILLDAGCFQGRGGFHLGKCTEDKQNALETIESFIGESIAGFSKKQVESRIGQKKQALIQAAKAKAKEASLETLSTPQPQLIWKKIDSRQSPDGVPTVQRQRRQRSPAQNQLIANETSGLPFDLLCSLAAESVGFTILKLSVSEGIGYTPAEKALLFNPPILILVNVLLVLNSLYINSRLPYLSEKNYNQCLQYTGFNHLTFGLLLFDSFAESITKLNCSIDSISPGCSP